MVKNYIGNEWVSSRSEAKTEIINPATGKVVGHCPVGTTADVDAAVQAAKAAFPAWREIPASDRVQYLFKIKAVLENHFEELAKLVTQENGKTLAEARGSVRRGIQMIETACGMPTLMMGEYFEDIASGIDCVAVRQPMGVFTTIAPFNFPAMVPFWFWPFAIACGNTQVLKPSERVPLTSVRIFELIAQVGLPKGVMNMVHGGKDVVNALLKHPDIKGVSFVGSTPIAKHVYQTGSAHGKRVQALGGAKNFMIVLPDAVMDRSVSIALESIIGCAGERCLAGSVVICVGDKTYDEVRARMVVAAKEVVVGDGLEAKTQMGPLISQGAKDRVKGLIQSAVDQGAKVLVDGREGVDHLPGYFLKPSVIDGVKPHMTIAQEEVFGPVVCLAKVDKYEEAIEWMNSSPFGNTATLFTTSGAAAREFMYKAHPAMLGINIGVPAPMSFFSFGGAKDSFFGDVKAHGKNSAIFFTDLKTVTQRWIKESSIW